MRIPYAATTPADPTPENQAIYDRIAERRKPRPITKLDLALLHNPAIANGWNSLLGAIRTKSSLSQALIELAVCRVAVLNNAVYEWTAHAPLALREGCKREALEAVLEGDVKNSSKLTDVEQDVLGFTEASTRQVEVPQDVFDKVRRHMENDQQMMELTVTVACYNMVSRFLVALDVTESNGGTMKVPELS